jgi:hypothetical protein
VVCGSGPARYVPHVSGIGWQGYAIAGAVLAGLAGAYRQISQSSTTESLDAARQRSVPPRVRRIYLLALLLEFCVGIAASSLFWVYDDENAALIILLVLVAVHRLFVRRLLKN